IEKNIVNGFMGDAVIVSQKQKSDNILLDMMGALIEPIANYAQIKPVLASQPYVGAFLPAGKNLGMALSDDDSTQPGYIFLIGVDFEAYQKMFPNNMTAYEGRLLKPGERGILVSRHSREQFYEFTNRWILPEGGKLIEANLNKDAKENRAFLKTMDNVVMLGMNIDNSATDIRFPVKGIIKYWAFDTIFGHFCITDIESYRQCLGYFTAAGQKVPVREENQKLLQLPDTNLDALFGSDSLVVENSQNRVEVPTTLSAPAKPLTPAEIENGVYNLVFVKFKDHLSPEEGLQKLNQALSAAKTGVRAISWKKAAGPIGSMTTLIKGALLLFVSFLFVVAVIIIVNTLTMAAMERTSEIGMMRAIGARKDFIRAMFFGETGMLSLVFGGGGLLLGIVIVNTIPLLHITTANDFVQLLYGGDTFHPMLKWADLLLTVIELGIVTVVAALYPVKVAGQIKPLDAIQRD
ncbi:MAG: FtsX-like permease family protein, partial [Candidatus Firestonebacteria bacterium]|nr:FtsX-like permease family protein [Candidatus Firestonebacteria bacterium]